MSNITLATSNTIKNLNTPQLLRGSLFVTWGASLLLLMVTIAGAQGQRNAINTVGKDATPSIITAQRLKDAMAGIDAFAASEFLAPPNSTPIDLQEKPQKDADGKTIPTYSERYNAASERLVAAAENITYGDDERIPIQKMQLGLGAYMTKIQQARDAHLRGDRANTLSAYRSATEILDTQLLPAADLLTEVNLKKLEETYQQHNFDSARSLFLIIVFGLCVLVVLIKLQLFLNQRTRRTLNPFLLGASAIAAIFLASTVSSLLSASGHLKVAKQDAFTSMYALRQARAAAYGVNSDQSRYLLESYGTNSGESRYLLEANRNNALRHELAFQEKISKVRGFLADEQKNITFPGEAIALTKNLDALSQYVTIDQQIRQLQANGDRAAAIKLRLGDNEGGSEWAFKQFRDANQEAYDLNKKAFDDAIAQSNQDIAGLEFNAMVMVLAIAGLTLLGLTPRLKEYAA
ncbi:hypothetical protein [Phormidesmis priestleyi]